MSAQPSRVTLGVFAWLVALVVGLVVPSTAHAIGLDIERPGQREFVVDHADLLDAETEAQIRAIAGRLLDEHATPIVVITIESMAAHGGERMQIETFARILFDQWGVGHPTFREQDWNTGILLLISKQDRKARIELGAGWEHTKDARARWIMDERIVPAFKRKDYSGGTLAGVRALDAMARSKSVPPEPDWYGWWYPWLVYVFVALLALAILHSIFTTGTKGWGWKLIVLVFTIVSGILLAMLVSSVRGACGGLERRGSFGGGRSGGGGATGSW